MLALRHQGSPHAMRGAVPIRDEDIPPVDSLDPAAPALGALDGVPVDAPTRLAEARQQALASILSGVRAKQLSIARQLRPVFSDVVDEAALPTITTLGHAIAALFAPRRPLRPTRRPRRPVPLASSPRCQVLVRVQHAFNVPVRADDLAPGSQPSQFLPTSPPTASGLALPAPLPASSAPTGKIVRPCVEVSFQRQTVSTRVALGCNPGWNEELLLPFSPPNGDFSSTALLSCTDQIYLNLYDEILESMRPRLDAGDVTSVRRTRRWLGTATVPISALYTNQTLEGTIRVNVPMVLLGYRRDGLGAVLPTAATTADAINPLLMQAPQAAVDEEQAHTYLRVFLTMDPPLRILPPTVLAEKSLEDDAMLAFCAHWEADLRAINNENIFRATAQDINATTMLVTRFICPQQPPPELIDPADVGKSMKRLARFVSCIPILPDHLAFAANVDVW